MSRPDAAPSDTSPSRGKKKADKKVSSEVNGDATEADDAPSRSHRRATAPKADTPARSTTEDAGEDPTVERSDTPAAAEKPAESIAPTRVSTSRPARKVVTSTAVATAPHVEVANDTKATVELDQPAAPATPATPDAPAGTGLWTMLSAAGRESRRTLFNRRPVLDNQQVDVTLDEYDDVSVPIAFNGTDADGDSLTYRVRRGLFGPKHGTVTVDPATGTFTYDADNEFALTGGRDRFLVRVSDYNRDDFHVHGLFGGHSDWAVITVNVAATDRAPVAGSDSVSVDEDGLLVVNPADLLANDTDPDGDDLSIDGYTQPEHGDLWINRDGSISYDPDDDFHGSDTFTYTVTDGIKTTTATVTVSVNPVNDAPVATDDGVSVDEDGLLIVNPAELLANDTDIDRDNLSIDGYTQPEHGDLWINRDGTISYDPDDDYNGTDTFTYTVTDGTETATATVTVTVDPVKDPPVATDDSVTVDEDGLLIVNPADLLANDTDIDGDKLSIEGYTQPEHGDLWINRDGTISYDPDDDYNGTDTFTYTVTDGTTTATATVTVVVNAVDDAPVITGVNVGAGDPTTTEVRGTVTATDPDGGTVTYSAPATTQYGTVTIDPDTGAFVYLPNEEFRDGGGGNGATITFSDPAQVKQGTFASTALGLNDLSDLTGRDATRNYIATSFTATATQSYTIGQSQAPEDTLMIVYSGTFDPDSPETGALVLNDDAGTHAVAVTGCGGGKSFCPEVTLDLMAGQRVSIVVTTWAADRPLGLPQSFYATGPGGFGAKPQEDTFVVTATDSSGATAAVSVTVPITPLPAVSAL
ncbi:Ig-like domain-containing protein [Mycobacterium sp. PSTR-4-N]|uniref:Ig-like domain-containing protein n=1 Tax=Mycobacterium sp. PSTR-4-N TaxID=2917745 RepID=UPI001F156642|nr:Ig-like domain-containing protein [Mycobacterium sp. PSTR-4-N]MCG7595507.1 Ig-like domain-containing protein [Mycobacterium sp. PSTR-4-N]